MALSFVSLRRRVSRASLFGLSLVPLIAATPTLAAPPSLPTGGVVRAGQASISAPSGTSLTVSQGSAKAIIDWASFSIGQGGTVRFDNGSGATLNRVTGQNLSSIDGLLSASGSVYLLNPNGGVIGKSGVVKVGGSFVASTLGLSDEAFLSGGDLTFSGASTAGVINLGKVGALGGDVVMMASTVRNDGAVTAARGDVGLLAGTKVLVRDQAVDGGRFAVQLGGAGTSVINSGPISAAMAELRANGGDVFALAGDTTGVIRATGVSASEGRVFLTAGDAGTVSLGGTIAARGPKDGGGSIETSAGKVNIGSAYIDAGPGGSWLLDPNDLTIDQTAANTIASTLNAGTNVTQQTTATGTGGSGDIGVAANVNLSWTSGANLTLSAYRNVSLGAASTLSSSSGGGAVTLYADNTGSGVGTVGFGSGAKIITSGAVNIFYNPASNPAGSTINASSYTSATDYRALVSGGGPLTAYMLVNTLADLQNVQNNLGGTYGLSRDIDASATSMWNGGAGFQPIGAAASGARFTGEFYGQEHTITNLSISRPNSDGVGLFSAVATSGQIGSLALSGAKVTGRFYTGSLIGDNYGLVYDIRVTGSVSGAGGVGGVIGVSELYARLLSLRSNATVTGTASDIGGVGGVILDSIYDSSASGGVSGGDNTGGLVGFSNGEVRTSTASGAVSGSNNVGGLVGQSNSGGGVINASYATGSVRGGASVGGLVGLTAGEVLGDYASGSVHGAQSVGGLVGEAYGGAQANGNYWDVGTTGTAMGLGAGGFYPSANSAPAPYQLQPIGGANGLSPYAAATYSSLSFGPNSDWVIFEGMTRPMLKSEASNFITNGHQLQLMDLSRTGSYALANDIDLSGTTNPSDVWNPANGFVPIAAGPTNTSPFTGSLDGQGHTISNLTIIASYAGTGLFGVIGPSGRVSNLNLVGAAVYGGYYAGLLAGDNYGTVSNVSAAGTLTGFGGVGGLIGVGELGSSVTEASSAVAVAATGQDVGGLLGVNLGQMTYASASGAVTSPSVVGGLVGFNDGPISQSHASGAVLASGTVQGIEGGGLVGQNYFAGVVSDTYATGSVTGRNTIGGLIGYDDGTATRSYATGLLTGAPAGDQNAIGGVLGGQFGGANFPADSPSNLVWDVATTGATHASGSNYYPAQVGSFTAIGGSTGKDPTQASSYPGFDFTNVWAIVPGVSRPTLRANPPAQ